MPSCFKLLMLLAAPFPFRSSAAIRFSRHSGYCRHSLPALSASAAAHGRLLSSAPISKLGFSIRPSGQFHAQAIVKEGHGEALNTFPGFKDSQSWPEWSKLADHLLDKGYSPQSAAPSDDDDSLLTNEVLSEEFLKATEACLGFARERPDILRLLSKKNVEVVVKSGYPFLFKNSEKSARRMRLFIGGDESNAPETEKAQTIDVMRYLLSFVQEALSTSGGDKFIVDESVETSVRKLLLELFNLSGTVWISKSSEPITTESPLGHEPLSRPPGQSFEMKRGDWICSKCTFMNFARNMNCLECGEGRPKRQLTGAEWECPQCDFFNYGRNTSCLRCDCKRPGEVLPTPAPVAGSEPSRSSNIEHILSVHGQDSNGGSSTRKLSSDTTSDSISRSLDRILGRSSTPGNQSTSGGSNTSTLGSSNSPEYGQTVAKQRRTTDRVPFVPLSPDMFRKTQESNNVVQRSLEKEVASSPNANELIDSLLKTTENSIKNNNSKESPDASLRWSKTAAELDNAKDMANTVSDEDFPDIMPLRKGENRFVVSKKKDRSLTSPAYKRRLAMEQDNNYNYIPFVPFPPDYFAKKDNQPLTNSTESTATLDKNETMPEGQGEHKGISDQGLEGSTSFQSGSSTYGDSYKPDYSGVKLNQSTTNSWDYNREMLNRTQKSSAFDEQALNQNMANASYGSAYSNQPTSDSGKYGGYPSNSDELSRNSSINNTSYGDTGSSSQQSNAWTNSNSSSNASWTNPSSSKFTANPTQPSNRNTFGGFTANSSQPPTNTWDNNNFNESTANSTQPSRSSWNNNQGNWSSGSPQTNNGSGSSYQQAQNHPSTSKNVSGGYSGKSLEGSCVKEPDPLDMSEEAKAERWFRRAAQIKDISELSQIPDEDFPEIMPMRKGVNRFVVSKRKTPQERRLTSPQYRRSLPIVSSEPEKDASN